MVRHLTVDETAKILGTTDRTVRRMLNEGRLSGSQFIDKGKQVWRVHVTKEILQRMQAHDAGAPTQTDVIDIQATSFDETSFLDEPDLPDERTSEPRAWGEPTAEQTKVTAGNIWAEIETRFIDRLTFQSEEIGRLKSQLEDSTTQIRLLEDRQRELAQVPVLKEVAEKAQAELESKSFELDAIKKQLASTQEEKESALRVATDAAVSKELIAREMEALKAEKEAESTAVKAQLEAMAQTLEELKRPWWSKLFGGNAPSSKKPDQ